MSIKFEVDFTIAEDEIIGSIQNDLNKAVGITAGTVADLALQKASRKLRSGLKWWEKGFKLEQASEGAWVLSISGKLAEMMEDGFSPREFKDLILKGNRGKYNKSVGKDYVDVPIPKNPNNLGRTFQGVQITVNKFKDVSEVSKEFTFSNPKKGGVQKERRMVKRIEDIMQSRKKEDSSAQFLTIRRLSEDSKWPAHPFAGARIFDALDQEIEQSFEAALRTVFG